MKRFRFACSHSSRSLNGVELACRRRAARRASGEPKCVGHWVVVYLIDLVGGTSQARKTWAMIALFLCSFSLTITITTVAESVTGDGSVVGALWKWPYLVPYVGLFGGLAASLSREDSRGGLVWLLIAPVASCTVAVDGIRMIVMLASPNGTSAESPVPGLARGLGEVLVGIFVLTTWVLFWTEFHERKRLGDVVQIGGSVVWVLMLVVAVSLVFFSGGRQVDFLFWVSTAIVVMVVLSSLSRIRRILRRMRV